MSGWKDKWPGQREWKRREWWEDGEWQARTLQLAEWRPCSLRSSPPSPSDRVQTPVDSGEDNETSPVRVMCKLLACSGTQTELEPGGDEIPKHLDYYETHQTYWSEIWQRSASLTFPMTSLILGVITFPFWCLAVGGHWPSQSPSSFTACSSTSRRSVSPQCTYRLE